MTCDSPRLAADALEPAELAIDFAAHGLGQVEGVELLAQFLQVAGLVVLAELLADGLELLAEEEFALPVAQLLLHPGLDVLLGIEQADLPLDVHQHLTEALLDGEGLEQDLALCRVDVDVAGHEVGELAGLVHAGQHLLHHLFGQAGLLAQFRGARARLAMECHEAGVLGVERRQLLGGDHDRGQVAVLLEVVQGDAAILALEQKLHTGQATLHLADPGDGPDGVEHIGVYGLDVLPL